MIGNGAMLIVQERIRQLKNTNFDTESDDRWVKGELAINAAELAVEHTSAMVFSDFDNEEGFERARKYLDIDDEIRRLQVAGAMIAAEIDRLERCMARNGFPEEPHPPLS